MDALKEILGLFYILVSVVEGLITIIKALFGGWANIWTRFYDKGLPQSPLWARVFGIFSSLLTHPLLVLPALYYLVDLYFGSP